MNDPHYVTRDEVERMIADERIVGITEAITAAIEEASKRIAEAYAKRVPSGTCLHSFSDGPYFNGANVYYSCKFCGKKRKEGQ